MDVAKSLFGSRPHDGYAGRKDFNDVVDNALSDEDDETGYSSYRGSCGDIGILKPTPGGPFSAVTPSLWPQSILSKLSSNPDDPNLRFDEFGFLLDEDGAYLTMGRSPTKHKHMPLEEDPQERLKWFAQLEFNSSVGSSDLSWESVPALLPKTDKLESMVRQGIPHSLRPQLYMRFSGALEKKIKSKTSYEELVKSSGGDSEHSSVEIEKDLLRSMPGNYFFQNSSSPAIPRLRRILRALAWLYPSIGYCQGMSLFCSHLLLIMDEESVFWMMCTIIEDLLPPGYFTKSLAGVHVDMHVLDALARRCLPDAARSLDTFDVDFKLAVVPWFSSIFATYFRHIRITLRIWDMFFLDGSLILFNTALGLLHLCESTINDATDTSQIFTRLSNITYEVEDVDTLIEVSTKVSSGINDKLIETLRKQKAMYKIANDAGWASDVKISRRTVKRSKSMLELILFGDELSEEDLKLKNIKQTEILVELRDAIRQVARHFLSTEPNLYNEDLLVSDYSIESHSKDLDSYLSVSRNRCRRAKALLDFERNDDDELGFRKNDIITIVSQNDEHCWVGELNGLRGWFPAKFVEVLDERSKRYSCAGDDSVNEGITDLVRGTFCPAFKQVLEHGMRRPNFLGGPCHPWLFIEEAATKEVERDFNSVYSRLVLCKTYRLDEDGKVLTPEELLYRCVQAVNSSHANAQMDVKLRSLVCLGLNEQVLHLWLEALCSCMDVVQKWYHGWSFINSPGWVQVKCELRILAAFAFSLNPDWELRSPRNRDGGGEPSLKDGVRDMLVKHHLFSWDL
ncbi:hypothetical protein GE061_002785 [Apolygus lucorum]|uniref:RUN and TBC1 domain-containing protein 3 n=1 Tax=Apolygus lucorum TaxID=248454 RepID=A0A8S9X7H2_APOLU|nr:hypothetical protein GE061_002785 [Apolygus lucorum]